MGLHVSPSWQFEVGWQQQAGARPAEHNVSLRSTSLWQIFQHLLYNFDLGKTFALSRSFEQLTSVFLYCFASEKPVNTFSLHSVFNGDVNIA